MKLQNKVVIVTGAAGKIGQGICRVLHQRGMIVIAADLDENACMTLIDELGPNDDRLTSIQVDITDRNSTIKMVESVVKRFGSIDALVNNAGIIELGSLIDLSEEKWDRVIDVNLKGTFLCTQAVAPVMIKQNSGSIVNLASVAAKRPAPLQSAYAATKHGVIGLTQVWSQELASHNITVNSVCPGFIDSPMWSQQLGPAYADMVGVDSSEVMGVLAKTQMPLGRPQEPEDIGEAVAFVCGAKNMTGQSLVIDGGFTRY
jgi:meso-butanediol dehydrogenase/(S,S)-butanediol dehydrogenase/diacetyl reductase